MRAILSVFVLGLCVLATQAKPKDCTINVKKDLKPGHPLLLKPNVTEFLYPGNEKLVILIGQVGVRVACPGGVILLKSKQSNYSITGLECVSKDKFKFALPEDDSATFSIKDLRCSVGAQSVARPLEPTKSGLLRSSIGFPLAGTNLTDFIPTIEEVVNGAARGQLVRWARVHIAPTILDREKTKIVPAYREGVFFQDVPMEDVYVKANQKQSFVEIFNDTKLAEKYMPDTGDKYFTQAKLISDADLFYESQQDAAYVYDNIVPVWESVNTNGNWKLVGDVVRTYASQSKAGLDVWSGGYQQLYLDDAEAAEVKFVALTHGVEPPQYLFKYVHDATANRGLVFVTLNNPHATRLGARDLLCDRYSSCDLMYPQFVNASRGLTYCCRLDDFRYHAGVVGLPTFNGAEPLF